MRLLAQGVALLALLAFAAWGADGVSPVQVVFLGYTNDAAAGRLARLSLTNRLKCDVAYGQAVEEKSPAGWPVYPNGGRLPHSAFVPLHAETNATLSVAVPTNGRTWRISVVYQELPTRGGEDFWGLRTTLADTLRAQEKYQAHWIWSTELPGLPAPGLPVQPVK
jgi:hypothetical protein